GGVFDADGEQHGHDGNPAFGVSTIDSSDQRGHGVLRERTQLFQGLKGFQAHAQVRVLDQMRQRPKGGGHLGGRETSQDAGGSQTTSSCMRQRTLATVSRASMADNLTRLSSSARAAYSIVPWSRNTPISRCSSASSWRTVSDFAWISFFSSSVSLRPGGGNS